MIQTKQKSRNVIELQLPEGQTSVKYLLMSDLHWDNPKCDRDLLKKHLDQALKENAKVFINGDLFCVMQGKGDPRGNKSDILPEHNNARYLDSVIKTASEWFLPYAEIIEVVGYGNHETSVLKHQETDVLERFVERLNTLANPKNPVNLGGYGGWIVTRFIGKANATKKPTYIHKIKYHHGFGGGGPVTKGTIQHQRMANATQGADVIWMGHVHEDYELTYSFEFLDNLCNVRHKDILMLRTASYKEEYQDGFGGFHVEKGRPVKPLGGRWLELSLKYDKKLDKKVVKQYTYKTEQ
jgi:hypothetical protein